MPNRLAREPSPYLRQHADNPVDWWPWCDEAFEEARRRDVPVLLSVGYSACHWCHVMAHESFEDAAVAEVMNDLFVNIKVDREERPDVDAIYMEATQAMTGSGGWPMTVFMAPDGKPFFAGTYFPKTSQYGRPSFLDVMEAVREAWTGRRDDVIQQADQLAEAVRSRTELAADDHGHTLSPDMLEAGFQVLASAYDKEWGGFGRAPKFPQVSYLELLFRAYAHNAGEGTREMLTNTLDAMASGGIYDHIGGGFSRYSVDAFWMVPHFEKMLYDQAQLLRAYVHGWQVTGEDRFRQVAEEIVEYVLRDLRSPDGGLYSAEDADSEGEEGKFYVWRPEEIAAVLDAEGLTSQATAWYGVTKAGNFEGSNILHRPVRGDLLRPHEVEQARQLLFDARTQRVRPGLDDKVLTEWNAMFLSALAEGGAAFERKDWIEAAEETAEFLLTNLRLNRTGRWFRSWQRESDGPRHLAYAVDHAWLIDAFTRLYEATGRSRWIAEARVVADEMLDLFWDSEAGGLFTTGDDGERLIVRQKDYYDGATPSANGVAALALLRLGALTGTDRYQQHAHGILGWLAGALSHHPQAFTYTLAAVDFAVTGPTEVVVAGDRPDLVAAVARRYNPNTVLAWGEPFDSPLWEGRDGGLSGGRAFVCRNYACLQPVEDAGALLAEIGGAAG